MIYSDSQLSVEESIGLEWGDLSPLCVRWKRKRREVAALHMVPTLITQLKVENWEPDIGRFSIVGHSRAYPPLSAESIAGVSI